jgi:hypothetical protein
MLGARIGGGATGRPVLVLRSRSPDRSLTCSLPERTGGQAGSQFPRPSPGALLETRTRLPNPSKCRPSGDFAVEGAEGSSSLAPPGGGPARRQLSGGTAGRGGRRPWQTPASAGSSRGRARRSLGRPRPTAGRAQSGSEGESATSHPARQGLRVPGTPTSSLPGGTGGRESERRRHRRRATTHSPGRRSRPGTGGRNPSGFRTTPAGGQVFEGIESPREHRAAIRRQRRDAATDSAVEQGPEAGRREDANPRRAQARPRGRGNRLERREGNGRGDAVRLPSREKLRRVWRHRGRRPRQRPRKRTAVRKKGNQPRGPETWRTPWPVAGCNRPAGCRAEETVGAGRNGKGGTRPERGDSGPKGHLSLRGGPGVDARCSYRRRGDLWEPQERSPDQTGRTRRLRPQGSEGARRTARTGTRLRRRGGRARRLCFGLPDRSAAGARPLEDQRQGAKVMEGKRERPTTRNRTSARRTCAA